MFMYVWKSTMCWEMATHERKELRLPGARFLRSCMSSDMDSQNQNVVL